MVAIQGGFLRKFYLIVYRYIPWDITVGQGLFSKGPAAKQVLQRFVAPYTMAPMDKDFEPLKTRLREINERLDSDEQAYFGALVDNFSGSTSEFQRIMRDLGKFGSKIGDGSKFEVYREVQHLFHKAPLKE